MAHHQRRLEIRQISARGERQRLLGAQPEPVHAGVEMDRRGQAPAGVAAEARPFDDLLERAEDGRRPASR